MIIYFKYFDGTNWSASESFSTVFYDVLDSVYRESGTTLNYIHFNHKLARKKHHTVVISADELIDANKLMFIKNIYIAEKWKLSTDNWSSEVEVILNENGNMPLELIEGNKMLREIKLTFYDKYTSTGYYA
jgi:hypothetical protein